MKALLLNLRREFLVLSFTLIGIALSAVAAFKIREPQAAQWFWFAGMGVAFVGLLLPNLNKQAISYHLRGFSKAENSLIPLLLFGLALLIRVVWLTDSPPFVHGDEAICGLYGRDFNAGLAPLLSIGWYGLPTFSYAVLGVGLSLLGDNIVGLRLTSAIIGSLGVVAAYFLGKTLFDRRVGIITGIILAFTYLDAILGRDGIIYIQGPVTITMAILFITLTLRRGGRLVPFFAALALVISLQVYWSARILFAIIPFMFVYLLITNRDLLRSRMPKLLWLVPALAVTGLPVLALILTDWASFGGHQGSIFIYSQEPGTVTHLKNTYQTSDYLGITAGQFMRILTTFTGRADASIQIGYDKAILDVVSTVLLPIAILFALLQIRKRWEYAVCLAWFFGIFFAGVFTVDPPWWPRLAAFLPAVALLLAALLGRAMQLVQTRLNTAIAVSVLGIILLALGVLNLRTLFVDFPAYGHKARPMPVTLIGYYLAKQPRNIDTLLLSQSSIYLHYETIKFLAPDAKGCTIMRNDVGQAEVPHNCSDLGAYQLFIIMPSQSAYLGRLQREFPDGKTELISDPEKHGIELYSFRRY